MPKISEQVVLRFNELELEISEIPKQFRNGVNDTYAEPRKFYAWASSALNAIQGVFGRESPHFINFQKEMNSVDDNCVWSKRLNSIHGIFLGAKNDIDGGHLFNLERSVSGELFASFIDAAKTAQTEGHYTVAAVLGCAALEDALKRYATANDLDVEGKTMEQVVNALKTKGLVSGTQKTFLSAMPNVRNLAMHAEWDKFTPEYVRLVISFTEQFLITNF